jgi:hypothetical protein
MSIIPKQNANLSAGEKRALLAQLLREKVQRVQIFVSFIPGAAGTVVSFTSWCLTAGLTTPCSQHAFSRL